MGICEIKSDKMCAQINTKGAELVLLSIDGVDHNWVWSAGEEWRRSAPLLFPIVGKLKGDSYFYDGKTYSMSQHGFARDSDFVVISSQKSKIVFQLTSSDSTKKVYPFDFNLEVTYEILNDHLQVSFKVLNIGKNKIYFNFGWHPGFVAPWGTHEGSAVSVNKVLGLRSYLRAGLISEKEGSFFSSSELLLSAELFAQDALVFKDLFPKLIKWRRDGEPWVLSLDCGDARHLGIWSKNISKFLCLEPWWGFSDDDLSTGELDRKKGIQFLMPQEAWEDVSRVWIEKVNSKI